MAMAGDMHRGRVVRLSLRVGEGGIVRAELFRYSSKAEPMPRTAAAAGGSSTDGVFRTRAERPMIHNESGVRLVERQRGSGSHPPRPPPPPQLPPQPQRLMAMGQVTLTLTRAREE